MWSFFGLLFVGGYFLYNILKESVQEIADDMSRSRIQATYDKLTLNWDDYATYTNGFFHIAKRFLKGLEEIEESMVYVFGEDWRKIILNGRNLDSQLGYVRFTNTRLNNPEGMAYNIYLAYHGYIVRMEYPVPLAGDKKLLDYKLKSLRLIEKYMQSAHPDMDLEIEIHPEVAILGEGRSKYRTHISRCEARWNFTKWNKDYGYTRLVRKLSEVNCEMWDEPRGSMY